MVVKMNNLKAIDQETIKVLNQKRIIQLLYRKKQLTKQEISKALSISIPTVITNVRDLIDQGFLDETEVGKSSGGRKPVIVRFLPDFMYSLGVLFTKHHIRIVLTNLNFHIIDEKILHVTYKQNDFNSVINLVKEEIDIIVKANNIPINKLLGIGFSLPGTVNEENLLLKNAPNLNLKNISFKDFQKDFTVPLHIENEANASAYAESFINFNYVKNSLVFLSITDGIGTGILINDTVYKGYNKRAGEFGHMTMVKGGRQCSCGKKGCWEMYASKKALLEEYNKNFNNETKSLKDFIEMTRTNLKAKAILNNYLDFLAEGIKNIILTLDPEFIIIDGEICAYKDLIETDLKNKIFEENNFYDKKDCQVSFSNLQGNAAILGAALMPMKKLFFLNDHII